MSVPRFLIKNLAKGGKLILATKLKNLHLTKVDFVDEGANQRADIKLTKRNDQGGEDPQNGADPDEGKSAGILKRFVAWLKGEGYTFADVEKAATSFEQQINSASVESITEEIWGVTYALRNALDSIIYDMELDAAGKTTAMTESLSQFSEAMQGHIPKWCAGQTAEITKNAGRPDDKELAVMRRDHEALGTMIEKANDTKGELEDMLKIDKSKMTPEERAAYEEMIKKYAVDVEDPEEVTKANAAKADGEDDEDLLDDEDKKKCKDTKKSVSAGEKPAENAAEALVAELRADIAKMKDEALTKELTAVAKKYEVIGKKVEDLVPTLKSLKAAGGTAYDDMIALLDDLVSAQESSGVFGEIGKSRPGTDAEKSGIAKARAKAAELRKSRPELSAEQALDEVLLADPELMAEFDK